MRVFWSFRTLPFLVAALHSAKMVPGTSIWRLLPVLLTVSLWSLPAMEVSIMYPCNTLGGNILITKQLSFARMVKSSVPICRVVIALRKPCPHRAPMFRLCPTADLQLLRKHILPKVARSRLPKQRLGMLRIRPCRRPCWRVRRRQGHPTHSLKTYSRHPHALSLWLPPNSRHLY